MYGSSFGGYLLKFTKTNTAFPNEYIANNGFSATPLQRTEKKAYRDSNNLLHRVTSPNHKTKLTVKTTSMNLAEARSIMEMLRNAYSNYQQRKLSVQYWDDEKMSYRTMTAYISDITYARTKIESNNIEYSGFDITFIEY